jgi:AcrR family transcriptional regulator
MNRAEIRMGRPSREEAEALADHVVDIADALFIERGYGATSMAMVASQARVGKQTLYRRFPQKEALFRKVIRRRIDSMILPPADGDAGCDPLGELKRLGRAALDLSLDREFIRLCRMIIAEALIFPELACLAADQWDSTFKDRCIDAIRRAQLMGVCRSGDPLILTECFIWSLIGEIFVGGLCGIQKRKADIDERVEYVWRVFVSGITLAKQ